MLIKLVTMLFLTSDSLFEDRRENVDFRLTFGLHSPASTALSNLACEIPCNFVKLWNTLMNFVLF